jgi:hypothetical protein
MTPEQIATTYVTTFGTNASRAVAPARSGMLSAFRSADVRSTVQGASTVETALREFAGALTDLIRPPPSAANVSDAWAWFSHARIRCRPFHLGLCSNPMNCRVVDLVELAERILAAPTPTGLDTNAVRLAAYRLADRIRAARIAESHGAADGGLGGMSIYASCQSDPFPWYVLPQSGPWETFLAGPCRPCLGAAPPLAFANECALAATHRSWRSVTATATVPTDRPAWVGPTSFVVEEAQSGARILTIPVVPDARGLVQMSWTGRQFCAISATGKLGLRVDRARQDRVTSDLHLTAPVTVDGRPANLRFTVNSALAATDVVQVVTAGGESSHPLPITRIRGHLDPADVGWSASTMPAMNRPKPTFDFAIPSLPPIPGELTGTVDLKDARIQYEEVPPGEYFVGFAMLELDGREVKTVQRHSIR